MTVFKGTIVFKGLNGKETTRSWYSQDIVGADIGAETLTASTNLVALKDSLIPLTDCDITSWYLTVPVGVNPGSGAGDVFNQANVVTYITTEKTANVNVPGASIGMFQGATGKQSDRVDPNDADLQAFVTALSDNWTVSDGEVIDDAIPTNGIEGGRRVLGKFKLGT